MVTRPILVHLVQTSGSKWEFNGVTVTQSRGIAFDVRSTLAGQKESGCRRRRPTPVFALGVRPPAGFFAPVDLRFLGAVFFFWRMISSSPLSSLSRSMSDIALWALGRGNLAGPHTRIRMKPAGPGDTAGRELGVRAVARSAAATAGSAAVPQNCPDRGSVQ